MVVAIIGILLLLAFLPQIIERFSALATKDADQEQADKEEELKRQDKGAVENTVDFIFGEGTAEDLQESSSKIFSPKDPREQTIEDLEKSASETFDTQVKFDPSTKVSSRGIITADRPPTANLLTAEEEIQILTSIAKKPRTVFIS